MKEILYIIQNTHDFVCMCVYEFLNVYVTGNIMQRKRKWPHDGVFVKIYSLHHESAKMCSNTCSTHPKEKHFCLCIDLQMSIKSIEMLPYSMILLYIQCIIIILSTTSYRNLFQFQFYIYSYQAFIGFIKLAVFKIWCKG